MRKTLTISAMVAALALSTMATAVAQGQSVNGNSANSLGKTTLDTAVSSWNVGDGNPNGEFVTAENQGVVIGLRAIEHHEGLLDVTGTNGNRVGVYEAVSGNTDDSGDNLATWNYDWHVDVSATDRVISDYSLVLEQDFTGESLFGVLGSDPVHLMGTDPDTGNFFALCADAVLTDDLCQQSWNPGFGNDDFVPTEAGTYNLRLVLTPETFNGPPVAVKIQVNVTN